MISLSDINLLFLILWKFMYKKFYTEFLSECSSEYSEWPRKKIRNCPNTPNWPRKKIRNCPNTPNDAHSEYSDNSELISELYAEIIWKFIKILCFFTKIFFFSFGKVRIDSELRSETTTLIRKILSDSEIIPS
jgi:hypothetical protein